MNFLLHKDVTQAPKNFKVTCKDAVNLIILTVLLLPQVWSTSTCEFVRTLNGHKRGIACLQYRDRLVVSGSSDNTIR